MKVVIFLDYVEHNSGGNRVSHFKSAERLARGRFEITSTITPELYVTMYITPELYVVTYNSGVIVLVISNRPRAKRSADLK